MRLVSWRTQVTCEAARHRTRLAAARNSQSLACCSTAMLRALGKSYDQGKGAGVRKPPMNEPAGRR